MVDYYTILSRAVATSEAKDDRWRRALYERARRTLVKQMSARRPPVSRAEIADEIAALEAAVNRIESEQTWKDRGDGVGDPPPAELNPSPIAELLRRPALIAFALVIAALCAGGYVYWTNHRADSVASAPANKLTTNAALTTKDGDVPPGIDGGPMDADQSYVFRRQPIFYRTLQPVGTVIVDKLQHFLYLVQPNNIAMRYGIGVGSQCVDLIGLRRVASMAEWPSWEAPPEMVQQRLAHAGILAGAPGNPLGARILVLDDTKSRIHGTNAPKTIGTTVVFGCIRLVNDDIIDLYGRVRIGTPVLVN
jgi:lipoprotein-anchoring transpeptidase ErfK/SrfK